MTDKKDSLVRVPVTRQEQMVVQCIQRASPKPATTPMICQYLLDRKVAFKGLEDGMIVRRWVRKCLLSLIKRGLVLRVGNGLYRCP